MSEVAGAAVVQGHIARFNAGVNTGDFSSMLAHFTDDAVLAFAGLPVGPFEGREAVARAYRDQPPDDTVRVLDVREDGDEVVARYAWDAAPHKPAGEMRFTLRGTEIAKLLVTFG